jgi:methoxymalonate biosynthesis protein
VPEPAPATLQRVNELVAPNAEDWDRAGGIPEPVLRELGAGGLLCAQVPTSFGGLGWSSRANGELTAQVGGWCSSVRSVMTSQGMAAWTIQRLGDAAQRARLLPGLCQGRLAAVAFSEPGAGSDLSAMQTSIQRDGDEIILTGQKVWCTAAATADVLVVFGRYDGGGAAVLVPTTTAGVHVRRIEDPLGCRAAGHADVRLDGVRLPFDHLLGGVARPLPLLVTTALAYGRMSVAWGCVGILAACLAAAARHAATRQQFGKPLAEHQLVGRHVAELFAAEHTARLACEHASDRWDAGSAQMVIATLLAKYVSATGAARGAATAVQVLASAGARDHHLVARAYRDAKLMELIEGSSEICQLVLAQHAVETISAQAQS